MKPVRLAALLLFLLSALTLAQAIERQPSSRYHERRVALANQLHGGIAILFAAEEPVLDFDPYRQDSDFFYLTGWNEPGADDCRPFR
jgi:Xaa-Pro aminopeptidase